MTDCIFCKIIAGDIPSENIYEDDDVYAFLDINPVQRGHTLVVPKSHSADLADMSDREVDSVFEAAKRLAPTITSAVGAHGFNLGMNNGASAGQVVFHAHLHIIPRFEGDGLKHWQKLENYDEGDFSVVSSKIRENL